jgi:regulator of protease activity HflC (stomatin/prohibitin superfamily)
MSAKHQHLTRHSRYNRKWLYHLRIGAKSMFVGFVLTVIAIAGLAMMGLGIFVIINSITRDKPVRGGVVLVIIGFVIAAIFFTMDSGIVEVKANEVGVVFNSLSGDLADEPLGPGMHIIIPGVQEVSIYSVAQQEYTMSGVANEGAMQGDDAVTARTSDGQQINLDITVIYRVNPANANTLHLKWQHRYQDGVVRPVVRNLTYGAVSQFSAQQIYGAQNISGAATPSDGDQAADGAPHAELEQVIEDSVRQELADEGLEVADVLIRNIDFSDEYVAAIEQTQVTRQQTIEAEFRVRQREQEAAQARAVAQGEADAARIRAQGEADALALINAQLEGNPMLLQWRYIESLGDNVQIILIPSNSPYLFDMNQLMEQGGVSLQPQTTEEPEESGTGQ